MRDSIIRLIRFIYFFIKAVRHVTGNLRQVSATQLLEEVFAIRFLTLCGLSLLLASCNQQPNSKAQQIINKSIEAHGGQLYLKSKVTFDFRDKRYAVWREEGAYVYTRTFQDDSLGNVHDVLINSNDFYRIVDVDTLSLSEVWKRRYSNSVNSVLYFVQLPYLLNDAAVVKSFEGEAMISNQTYFIIKVTFASEGGGEDYEDEYMYWINQDNYHVDYLAYSYHTDGGGIRFRKAYNRQRIGGILFQDYINYKVPKGTDLNTIPDLYEADKLTELSRIENTNIKVQPN